MPEQTEFDAYHKWLGIPPSEQPPNFYRLLGVVVFESDLDVIEAAADQRMAHVRTYQTGKHGVISQKLLNELAEARVTLLNPDKKAEYDAQVGDETASEATPELLAGFLEDVPPLVSSSPLRPVSRRKRPNYVAISAVAAAACVIVLAGVYVMFGRRAATRHLPAPNENPRERQQTVNKQNDEPRSASRPRNATPLRILQAKRETYHKDGADRAIGDGGSFFISIAGDVGEAAVGYELEGARRLTLEARVTGEFRPYAESPENSFAGFMIDFHTPSGYVSRVALSLALSNERRSSPGPLWGRQAPPDRLVDLAESELKNLDFQKWAPAAWDGRVWLSALLQNCGPGISMSGRLVLPQSEKAAEDDRQ